MTASTQNRIEYDVPDLGEMSLRLEYDVFGHRYPRESHPDDKAGRGMALDIEPRLIGGRLRYEVLEDAPQALGLWLEPRQIAAIIPRHVLENFEIELIEQARVGQ